jgi:hypothetical protein
MSFFITNSYTTDGTRGNDDYPVPDAFVVRYKTGFQLSSNWLFNPSATDSIPGVTTVHRFNACQGVQTFDMESYTKEQAEPRMIMAKNGKFYKSEVACTADGTAPVALVVYVGDNAEVNGDVAYRGLAMSYTQKYEVKWDDSAKRDDVCLENTSQNSLAWEKQNNGIERTQKLNNEEDHSHYAAHDAWMFQVDDFNPSAYGYSRWFLPTAGQAIMAIRGLGGTVFLGGSRVIITFTKNLKKELEDAGITSFKANFDCWTSTEYDSDAAIYFSYENGEVEITASNKDDKREVRPFIAF